jgi:hypothetical protein
LDQKFKEIKYLAKAHFLLLSIAKGLSPWQLNPQIIGFSQIVFLNAV